ncbi:hypothetical protein BBK36DRAFT_141410 [Trichoderma citrinoviride]|uniref:WSC domain-containing protein n=1 Tax=Trichoderma citrinoviride TaxID=58853 RepID=A0A2T4B6H0_9HYPO|nr:hypothetical protein BBK36DRAFT_141410 [Trichoderma citrinoviride]PTB64801.1 hypothetical protein BBK36DRAFT_141410 [Trichoderma citrinoviride]
MRLFRTSALQKGCFIFLVLAFSTLISAVDVNVCSSFNTAETPLNVSIYQTNGLCQGFCIKKNYALAITQQNSCWCSNYYPDKGSTVDVKDCNVPCPAWPTEYCGGQGLFGYLVLNEVAPSGTKTAPASSTTPTQLSTVIVTDSVTKTVVQSTASTSASTSSSSMATSTSASSTSSSSSSSSSSTSSTTSSSTSETPTTSTSSSSSSRANISSSTGSSPTPTEDPSKDQSGGGSTSDGSSKKSGLSSGAIAGIAVGVVGGVLAIAAALLFWFLRRRRQGKDEYQNDPSVRGSSSGMVGVPGDLTGNSGSPASPVSVANRNSTIQIDPRMDPFKQGLYIRGSHESLNTLRDDHDYSRRIQPPKVLRAVNPDPEEP